MGPGSRPGRRGFDRNRRRYLPRAIFHGMVGALRKQQGIRMRKLLLAVVFGNVIAVSPAFAARCGGDFNSFVAGISADARAAGVSEGVIGSAFSGVTVDAAVLNFDRRQRYTFNKTFEQYVSTRVGAGRINGGRAMLVRHAARVSRIGAQVGGPRPVLAAIWG